TLGALQAGPNQHFLLEEAARTLGLNPTELEREFSSRRVGQRIPTDRRIPGQIDRPRAESRTSVARMQSNQDPTAVRLMRTERNLLLEILLNPALVARFHQQLGRLEYSDPHSELLWRFLEARFLTGNIWSGSELRGFDLPADTMQVFIQALMSRSAAPEESRPAEELNAVMEDLLLQHERHSIQKKIAEIRSRYDVADSVERSYLIEEEKRYTDDLQRINTRLRGGDPQRKEQGGHKT
ncbi:MAG: hypothetical protein KDK34_06930, partial [Leptospiraceae bacterium]|nr:hypothetical protein [Leptospiraceae bacterium]